MWCQECCLQKIVDCRSGYYVLMKAKQTLQLYADLENGANEWIGPQLHHICQKVVCKLPYMEIYSHDS